MHVTRFDQAPAYEAPNHVDMRCLRLQGKEAGPSTQMWMGMSQILPGGHTGLDGSPIEKLYLVLEGQLHVVGRARRPARRAGARPLRLLPLRAGREAAARQPQQPARCWSRW